MFGYRTAYPRWARSCPHGSNESAHRPVGPPWTSTTRGLGLGARGSRGLSSAASISTPSKLLYFTNSGATAVSFAHFSFSVVTARGPPLAGLTHSSGARVAVSPTYASVPRDERANADGFTTSGSSTC